MPVGGLKHFLFDLLIYLRKLEEKHDFRTLFLAHFPFGIEAIVRTLFIRKEKIVINKIKQKS